MRDGFDLSRRQLLAGSGALCFAFLAGGQIGVSRGSAMAQGAETLQFGPWVRISADGRIVIRFAATEMGQGVSTALPMILAEEMDAEWEMVDVEQVSAGPLDVFGNTPTGGIM